MILWEYLIQFTFILSLFYGSLEIQGFLLTKTRTHANSFRTLTQSTFLKNRPSSLSFLTKKVLFHKKSHFMTSTLLLKENTYQKKRGGPTRPLPKILNQKGEIHLLSSMLFFLLILATFFLLLEEFQKTRMIIERKNHYLCLKSVLEKNFSYTKEMGKLNQLIAINYPLQFNPKTGPVHKNIIKGAKIYQEILTKKFKLIGLKNLSHCSRWQKIQLLSLYHYEEQSFGLLRRDSLERAKSRDQDLTLNLFPKDFSGDLFALTFLPPSLHQAVKIQIQPFFGKTL